MPDESQNTQVPAGNQDGTVDGQANAEGTQGQQPSGGPSEEQKALRLERENEEMRERLKRLEEQRQTQEDSQLAPEEKFTKEQDTFYREKAADSLSKELGSEIEKLPKALQERIKANPFNPAWLDEKVLEFELYGVDTNDPKAKYEAAVRAAKKAIPQFVEGFIDKPQEKTDDQGLGNNPPIDQGNSFSNGGKGMEFMSDEELEKIAKMGRK